MKKNMYLVLMLLAVSLPFSSCNDEDGESKTTVLMETNFNDGVDGWTAVYAAYPEIDSVFYELVSGIRSLPAPLDQTKKAFMLSGNNHSDALQMFIAKQLSGLDPLTNYKIETEVELASQYPDGSVGIGGSPGNSVYLVSKFATLGYTLEEGEDEYDNVELILNKDLSIPESTLEIALGDVSIPSDTYVYQLINRKKSSSTDVIWSDQHGKLWAVIGTWSGFEGISSLYYTKIKITLTRI